VSPLPVCVRYRPGVAMKRPGWTYSHRPRTDTVEGPEETRGYATRRHTTLGEPIAYRGEPCPFECRHRPIAGSGNSPVVDGRRSVGRPVGSTHAARDLPNARPHGRHQRTNRHRRRCRPRTHRRATISTARTTCRSARRELLGQTKTDSINVSDSLNSR